MVGGNMGKKWIDANDIGMINELPTEELRELDIEMRKKPNFDKDQKGERGCIKNEKYKKTFKTNKKDTACLRYSGLPKIQK
jgi:hypothetical protein